MKNFKLFVLLTACLTVWPVLAADKASQNIPMMTYVNARFQFEVNYPKDLLEPDPPPDNNDGLNFYSKDKQVHLVVTGRYNVLDYSWKQEFQSALDLLKDTKITYKVFKKNTFVISGYRGDKIFYHKEITVMEDDSEVYLIFEIEYPQKDKGTWNAIAATCASSFKMSKDSSQTDDFK